MRVLHVIPSISPAHGGPSQAMTMMEQALGIAGVAVTTVTTDDDGPRRHLPVEAQLDQVNGVNRVYAHKLCEFYKVAPGLVPWLWRYVRDFDLVHIHALFSFASVAAGLTALQRGVPYVVRPLGTLSTYGVTQRRPWFKLLSLALVERHILQHAAAVHFTSQAELAEAKAQNIPFRGVVIPLGVALGPPGNPQDLLRKYPILRNSRVVLYLSRLDPKKNVEGLLRAFAALESEGIKAVLVIAGSGEPTYVVKLQSLAQSLGLAQQVIWLGHVDGLCKAAALSVADLFVLPSFSENFGIAAVEALFSGLPCVLGRGVAIAEEVRSAGAGVVVEPEPAAITQALAGLIPDQGRRGLMGERGRQFAQQNYSTAAMAVRLVALYQNIAEGREVAT